MTDAPAPFLDPSLIVTAIEQAVAVLHRPVAVSELGTAEDARDPKLTEVDARIHVIAERTEARGPGGMGSGRDATETLALVLRVRDPSPDDDGASARVSLRSLRGVVFAALEGRRIDPAWSPLRYLGGELLVQERGVYKTYHWVERYAADTRLPVRPRTAV